MAIYIKTCIVVVGAGAHVRTTPIATSCRITKRRTYVRDRNYNTHHGTDIQIKSAPYYYYYYYYYYYLVSS